MKYYYFLGRLLKWPLTACFFLYCIVTRAPRVRILVRNEYDELLLVKTWTSTGEWTLPGGGVDRGESPSAAACRELYEETGIKVPVSQLKQIGSTRSWGHDEIVFALQIARDQLPDKLPHRHEIQEACWFANKHLPKLGPLAKDIMQAVAASR